MALFLLEVMIQVELYPTEKGFEGQKKSQTKYKRSQSVI